MQTRLHLSALCLFSLFCETGVENNNKALNVDFFQPLYQMQTVKPVPSSNRPALAPKEQQQPLYASVQKKPASTTMNKATRHTATLSSNLSELDNLLAELNTSQYVTTSEQPVSSPAPGFFF